MRMGLPTYWGFPSVRAIWTHTLPPHRAMGLDDTRKRAKEAGVSNLKASVEDGELLSGFDDNSVDALTCTWGLESMMNHTQAIHVSARAHCLLFCSMIRGL